MSEQIEATSTAKTVDTDTARNTQRHEWARFMIGLIVVICGGYIAKNTLSAKKQILEAQEAIAGDLSAEFQIRNVEYSSQRTREVAGTITFINDSLSEIDVDDIVLEIVRVSSTGEINERLANDKKHSQLNELRFILIQELDSLEAAVNHGSSEHGASVNLKLLPNDTMFNSLYRPSYDINERLVDKTVNVGRQNVAEAAQRKVLVEKRINDIDAELSSMSEFGSKVFVIGKCAPENSKFQPIESLKLGENFKIAPLSKLDYTFRMLELRVPLEDSGKEWFKYNLLIRFHDVAAPDEHRTLAASIFTGDSASEMPGVVCSPSNY